MDAQTLVPRGDHTDGHIGVFISVPSKPTIGLDDSSKNVEVSESDITLWPPPKKTATLDDDDDDLKSEPMPLTLGTKGVSKDTIVIEESTMTKDKVSTKKDSGRTVTIPNSEVVTVTRHTTILTDQPPPLPTFASSTSSAAPSHPEENIPEQTSIAPSRSASPENPDGAKGAGLPTGALVGIAIGGAAVVALLVIIFIILNRRKKTHQQEQDRPIEEEDAGREDNLEEKHFPQQMSAHTTGTQGSGGDPFAPFGGRVDSDSQYPNRPQSNTFEMDATSAAPVELPDTSPISPSTISTAPPVPVSNSADPRANLNSLGKEDGTPKYVNHWNQYKTLGSS